MRHYGIKLTVSVLSFGAILAYCAAASSVTLGDFAPQPMGVAWLHVASFVTGLAMAMLYRETAPVFGGTVLISLAGGLIFGGALAIAILAADWRLADLIGLYAFQQTFPRMATMCVFGLSGAFLGTVGRHMFGSE